MSVHKLFVLPGDGIGPEVMAEVEKIANFLTKEGIAEFRDRARPRRRRRL